MPGQVSTTVGSSRNRHLILPPSIVGWPPVFAGGVRQGQKVPLQVSPRLQGISGSQPEVGEPDADLLRAAINQERQRGGVHGASGRPLV